jgi:hypothetical protein
MLQKYKIFSTMQYIVLNIFKMDLNVGDKTELSFFVFLSDRMFFIQLKKTKFVVLKIKINGAYRTAV